MTRLARVFGRARDEGRAAFIPYLTAGDPSLDATIRLARALEGAGADVLELGVPFSDPIADGPVLQRAASRAIAAGASLSAVLTAARTIREETNLALVLFSYLNPLLRHGIRRVAAECRDAGIDGVLVTDLPPEEAGPIRPALAAVQLDMIFLVSPTSTPSRMRQAARLSSGFLYVVSRSGTTGIRRALPTDLSATVERARACARGLPIAVGFGIATPAVARRAALMADGVVVGSALVREAEVAGRARVAAVAALAGRMARACRRPRARVAAGTFDPE